VDAAPSRVRRSTPLIRQLCRYQSVRPARSAGDPGHHAGSCSEGVIGSWPACSGSATAAVNRPRQRWDARHRHQQERQLRIRPSCPCETLVVLGFASSSPYRDLEPNDVRIRVVRYQCVVELPVAISRSRSPWRRSTGRLIGTSVKLGSEPRCNADPADTAGSSVTPSAPRRTRRRPRPGRPAASGSRGSVPPNRHDR
jgi:hypothetical protein